MSFFTPVFRTARPLSCRFHRNLTRAKFTVMPLRAKIIERPSTRGYTTTTNLEELVREQPGDELDDVVFSQLYGLRTIELNRPKKLNSLNGSMARKIVGRLTEWRKSDLANVIVIQGRGRAFCAGGDVAALALWNKEGAEGQQRSSDYFALEYKLDHLIATYSKPYVAYMDGITMGGGVGLSVHAPFRIATENTVFAMPETTIGFFPDVGGGFFLPRLDGGLGTYLALTSEQLKGVDVFYHGIATHYLHSSSLPALSERLSQLQFDDYATLQERQSLVNSTIAEFTTTLPAPRPRISGGLRRAIDECFSLDSLLPKDADANDFSRDFPPTKYAPKILRALKDIAFSRESDEVKEWASKTIKTIRERSPTSVAITLQQMLLGRNWSISQTFQNEHVMARAFMAHPDFVEGVTARLIERKKERPDWQPNQLEDVTDEQISSFFRASSGPRLALIGSNLASDYKDYPARRLGLPTDNDILEVMGSGDDRKMKEEVVQVMLERWDHKFGVREKVEEVVERFEGAPSRKGKGA